MSDYYMPEELLTKIFMHLPAKSLVRFTCVCRKWYSLITSPDFIITHHNQATLTNNDHPLLVRYCHEFLDNNERISVNFDSDTYNLCVKLDSPFQSSECNFYVYGSCKGLILLSNGIRSKNTLMFWNPSIRKSLTLPRLRYMYSSHSQIFGFGFDSRTNDYKVVRLVYLPSKGYVPLIKVEVYKHSTRSWETITATFDPSCTVFDNYFGDTFLNGAVHWHAYKKMDSDLIMSFNMSDEEFSEIKLPPNLDKRNRFKVVIAICRKWLSLFHISNSMYCSVWAMKEYGVVESWTKLYTLNLWHGAAVMTPLGSRKNGELLLRLHHGELFSYDSETYQIKYLGNSYACRTSCLPCVRRFEAYYTDAYVESLVLLGDANRLGAGDAKQAKKKRKNKQGLLIPYTVRGDYYSRNEG